VRGTGQIGSIDADNISHIIRLAIGAKLLDIPYKFHKSLFMGYVE
jgi:hypothetical protein